MHYMTDLLESPLLLFLHAEAPTVSGDVSSAWGSAGYLSASSYRNDGCISADGYWRPACPAVGATANTSLPENICISNKCGTFQLGGVVPPLFVVDGRRLQSRTLTLTPGDVPARSGHRA